MEFSAKQIAQLLQGVVEGNEEIIVNKLCKIEEGEEGGLSFLANPKYTQYIYTTKSSIVIVNQDFVAEEKIEATLIRVKDAYSCFANLLEIYNQYRFNKKGISSLAVIDQKATVGEDNYIGEFVVVSSSFCSLPHPAKAKIIVITIKTLIIFFAVRSDINITSDESI